MDAARPVLDLDGPVVPVRSLLRDVHARRELIWLLARREFASRYRSTRFGVVWSAAVPLLQAAVLTVVFTQIVHIDVGEPYAAFVLCGTACWQTFSIGLVAGTTSIIDSSSIASRIYFPRLVLPLVPALAALPGLGVTLVVAVVTALVQGVDPGPQLAVLPLAVVLLVTLTVSFALVLALVHARFRDTRYVVQAVLIGWFYVTPIFFSQAEAGDLAWLVSLNPVTGTIELVRYAILGSADRLAVSVLATITTTVVLSVAALLAYRRFDRNALDRL